MKANRIFRFLGQADNALRRSLGVVPRHQEPSRGLAGHEKHYIGSLDTPDSVSRPCDTICVHDKSGNMSTTDCRPSRIEASKRAARQYIMRRAESSPHDRIALVLNNAIGQNDLSQSELGRACTLLGAIEYQMGRPQTAQLYFLKAYQHDPGVVPSPELLPPQVIEFYNSAHTKRDR